MRSKVLEFFADCFLIACVLSLFIGVDSLVTSGTNTIEFNVSIGMVLVTGVLGLTFNYFSNV